MMGIKSKLVERFAKNYGIPLLAVLVALHQLTHRSWGLTSWKGGGFGMYAEFHPVYNKLLIFSDLPITNSPSQTMLPLNELLSEARLYPNKRIADRIKAECKNLYGENTYRLEVWKPVFEPDSCRFWLTKVKEY